MAQLRERLARALAGRYTIERELGRGGMAVVFLARDTKHERAVALKVLRPELSAALGPERFLREIKVAARLAHPHILPLHDSDEADGLLYYTMPYVEGESLRRRLDREQRLPVADALRIAREVADALEYAHAQDVVHRDIKPENILLEAGHAVVADFGLARAISAAGGDRVTAVGIAVGTPDYMSPEQAGGQQDVDGRSDVYSLGCVLYEMLTGRAPFLGRSANEIMTGHVHGRVEPVDRVSPDVPRDVARALERALAKTPAERFTSARELADALLPASPDDAAARRRSRRRRLLAGGSAGVAATVVVLALWDRGPVLDPARYVVVPFEHRDSAAVLRLTGDQCEYHLATALRPFEGIEVLDYFLVQHAWQQSGGRVAGPDAEFAMARKLGAGRLVRGDVSGASDSVVVRAAVFDVRRRRTLHQAEIGVLPGAGDVAARFERLAVDLLGLRPPDAPVGPAPTRVVAAGRAYVDGRAAITRGDFAGAMRLFRTAIELDAEFAEAHFWLAQVMAWAGRPAAEWRASAQRAVELRGRLHPPDSQLAEPLHRLAQGEYRVSCLGYRAILVRDSTNFVAWLGLGECLGRDSTVVRDTRSPSGWAFRSSYHAAVAAYRRALELTSYLTPAFYARMRNLLKTEPQHYRPGVALPPDTGAFWAFPTVAGDTVAFVPYRQEAVQRGAPLAGHATRDAALARSRELLRDIVGQWAAAYPQSAEAHEALAQTLESFGQLTSGGPGRTGALDAAREARRLARTPAEGLRSALTEVRLLVKTGQFVRARALADSLLEAWPAPGPSAHDHVGGLAALTGRASRTADLLAGQADALRRGLADVRLRTLPLPLFEARERLRAYAVLGGPRDSVVAWAGRFDTLLASLVGPMQREPTRRALLDDVMAWAYPVLGATAVHRRDATNYLLRLQWRFERGDVTGIRAQFDTLQALRAAISPGAIAISYTYQEALVLLALGDTAQAEERLDRALTALPTMSRALLADAPDPAGLVRAMALRARLAAGRDPGKVREWGEPVLVLWRDADAGLRPLVDTIESLVRQSKER